MNVSPTRFRPEALLGAGTPFALALHRDALAVSTIIGSVKFPPITIAKGKRGGAVIGTMTFVSISVSDGTSTGTLTINIKRNGVVVGTAIFTTAANDVVTNPVTVDLRDGNGNGVPISADDTFSVDIASTGTPSGMTDANVVLFGELYGFRG